MTPDERWLAAMWPFVRHHLPAPPAQVVELGCGPLGGFVPMLRSSGYEAVGVDPEAPQGPHYHRIEFEHAELRGPVDVVVASTSLHHVRDPGEVIDGIAKILASEGTLVVVEWDWEKFDEPTARWCFQRLGTASTSWLRQLRDEWIAAEQDWDAYFREWAEREGLHSGQQLLRLLGGYFHRLLAAHGPYFFPDLPDTSDADEQAAIDAGAIQATRIDYVGKLRMS